MTPPPCSANVAAREWRRGEYLISTDKARLDVHLIHDFLARSYWAKWIPLETVQNSIEHSLNFGLYANGAQVGFARVITDFSTFAYVGDVFVLEPHRGCGLARWMMESIRGHPELQGLRRWVLLTRDAHALYRLVGFRDLAHSEWYMEIHNPDVYRSAPHE